MRVVTTIGDARKWRARQSGPLGLVPTMGALHAGHLSLLARARAECAQVAVSLFVNPAQFGPREDLARYPRDFGRDRQLLVEGGCDLLFAPPPDEMYPAGFDTWVVPGAVADPLEGQRRPGHFRGVCTVVAKLLHVVQPDRAYFGRKDAQQLAVITRMVRDLDLPAEVVPCDTVRDPDGVALSSRNAYLSPEERRAAPVLKRALDAARDAFRNGERDGEGLREVLRDEIGREPLARLDYGAVVDPETLGEMERVEAPALALLAVFLGRTRLIDNLLLSEPTKAGAHGTLAWRSTIRTSGRTTA